MFNEIFVAVGELLSQIFTIPLFLAILSFSLCVSAFKFFYDLVFWGSLPSFFELLPSKSDPLKFADKVFNNSDLKKDFYSILDLDLQYFEVWYSPNKRDIKKFKKTALLSLKCLIIELFYFESDLEAISSFYDSESFDVVLFSIVLGEHSDLKYYHDLPDFFRILVNDKEKILLLKEQTINGKK